MTPPLFRRLVAAYVAIYLLVRAPAFWALRSASPQRFEGVGLLSWLDGPVGDALVVGGWTLTVVLAAMLTFDIRPGVVGPAFAAATLTLFTYRSSFGQVLWFDHLPALHALVVGLTARAKSDDGWTMRLAAIVTVTTYLLAGIAKLRIGGTAWVTDGSLANHIAYSAARLQVLGENPSPFAAPLLSFPKLLNVAGLGTLAIELMAPLALLRRVRAGWVLCAWIMHVAIAASMFVVFPYPLAFVAFAPLFAREPDETPPTRRNRATG